MRQFLRSKSSFGWLRPALLCGVSLLATACSSDSSRFSADNPFSNPFKSAAIRDPATTASVAKTGASVAIPRTSQVSSAPLPPPMSPVPGTTAKSASLGDQRAMVTGSLAPSRAAVQAPVQAMTSKASVAGRFNDWSTQGGSQVVMAHGESVDTLAGRYGVPSGAILAANGLSSPGQVTPGTKLTIPVFNPGGQANMPSPVAQKVASASGTLNDASSARSQVTSSLQKAAPPAPIASTRAQAQPERIKTAMARPLSEEDSLKPIRPPAPLSAPKPADAAKAKADAAKAKADELAAKAAADKARKDAEAKSKAEAILRQRAQQAEREEKRKAEAKAKTTAKPTVNAEDKAKADARTAEIAKARAEAEKARKEAALAKAEAEKAKKDAQAAAKAASETKAAEARRATEQKVAEQKTAAQPKAEPARTTTIAKAEAQKDEAAEAPKADFRWPARGRVINGFSGRGGNEGINIAVPEGTPIKAAEGGTVAYAGSELKGYGNLVLIRHDNGYVSAYAHNSELAVKKGDKVGRGQTIAKSGQTGNVSSPQVHFELRKGSSPVDPTPYLN